MESADEIHRRRAKYIHNDRMATNNSSRSQAESGVVLSNPDVNRRGKERIRRLEHLDGEYSSYSPQVRNRNQGINCELNADRPDYAYFHNIRTPVEPLRPRSDPDECGLGSKGLLPGYSPVRGVSREDKFNYFLYRDEGPSNYDMNSYYEHDERTRYPDYGNRQVSTFEDLENDRVELVRELDELQDQLSWSCDVRGKPSGRISTNQPPFSPNPHYPYPRHYATYVQEDLLSSQEPFSPDYMTGPYLRHTPEFMPYTNRYVSSLRGPHPQRGIGYPHDHFSGSADNYQQKTFQRPQSQYLYWPYHEQFDDAYYEDANHSFSTLHSDENFFHHLPPGVDPSRFYSQRSRDDPLNPNYNHHLNPIRHGAQSYSSGGPKSHNYSNSGQSLASNSTDLAYSKNNAFNHHRPRKVAETNRSWQVWHPIAGGAPFITCRKCFQLLRLPMKHILSAKKQQKMKCGACGLVILIQLGNKGLTVSDSASVNHLPTEIDDGSSVRVDQNGSNSADTNAFSNDHDDSLPKVSPTKSKSDEFENEKQLDSLFSRCAPSEDEQIPENLASKKHGSSSAEIHLTEIESLKNLDFSSEECPHHCSDSIGTHQFDKGNEGKRSEFGQSVSRQNSTKDEAVATEMDMSLHEFSNSCVSKDSVDKSEEDHQMVNKVAQSFYESPTKESFKGFQESDQNVEVGGSQVFVNGKLIPDRVLKKAEMLAGPIQPGEYWYDIQAGFWGVMGHPCLGIIMPNIEEFNHPMPDNCGGGNTLVFVNGRELHQRDLDLLVSRGLPNTRGRSYLIEISGKVVDEQTEDELNGLGRLAPTVERAKRGFGMKIPTFIARLQNW